jgi:hypothetical protein
VRLLYRLQQVDTALIRAEERLSALDPGDALRARLAEAEGTLAAARRDLAAKQARARDLELELQSTEGKRKKMEEEMYSGRVRNPKELAAMQEDVSALGRHAQDLETAILGLLEEIEAGQAREHALGDQGHAARSDLERHAASYQEERATLEASLAGLRRERAELADRIDADLLRRYDRIRERMGPIAVAAVRKGICEGCHVAIPEGRVRRLQEEKDLLLTCERCGRILVLPE